MRSKTNHCGHLAKKWRTNIWGYAFMAPFILAFVVFFVYPIIEAFRLSLYHYTLVKQEWVGLQNYISLFRDKNFLKSLRNTFAFVLICVPATTLLSLFVANTIRRYHRTVTAFFRAAFYLPSITASAVLAVTWKLIYNPQNGVLNWFLSLFGADPVLWLSDSRVVLPALAVIVITWQLGYPVILFCAGLDGIPSTYIEAANIDGASKMRTFWQVIMPLLKPTTLYVVVTNTIGSFQTFAVVQLLTSGGPNYATSTIMYQLYETAFKYGKLGLASAMGIILAILIGIVAIFQFRLLSADVEY